MDLEGGERGEKKYIGNDKWRERGNDKGDMERVCVYLGVR